MIGSDRFDATTVLHKENIPLEHSRNGIPYCREILDTKRAWRFTWTAITQGMVRALEAFYEQPYFRYYPESSDQYFEVYIPGPFTPEAVRGGRNNLTQILKEYGDGLKTGQ